MTKVYLLGQGNVSKNILICIHKGYIQIRTFYFSMSIIHIESISKANDLLGHSKVKHPLIGVANFTKFQQEFEPGIQFTLGFCILMFKKLVSE
jgi:hypothetical protein